MQQIFELLLTKQESPASINYSLIYRHSKGLFAFDKEIGLDKQILLSDQSSIKCMAVSNYGIVFGGEFGIVHIGKNINQFDLKANSIAFSQDYEYIIVTAKETHIISTRTNKLIKSFPGPILFDSTNSLCFCKGTVYETATFSELKQFKGPEGADFSISVQRDSLYVSNVTLIKHLQPLKDCMLIIDNYITGQHFEHYLPPANEVKQLWSQDGKILLLWSQVLDDHTNQSYFGTHNLHLWTENELIKIDVFEGPIHDVKWVEDGFIVISGYMPAGAVLFNLKGQKQYLILQAHINAIYPKNDVIALAGFGNLSGEIFIYNLKDMKKIGSLKQDKVVSFEWSPSGKYFLLATTFPRLRVDNQFIICTRTGQFIHKQKFDEFYEIKWINDDNLLIENNIVDTSAETKQVTLTTGVDFIKQMKEAQINDQPRKLSNDEKLQNLRPIQQAVQLVPTNPTQNGKPQQSKPAPVLMRRQEPIIQYVQQDKQVQEIQEQPVQVEKKQRKKLNLTYKPIEKAQDLQTQFFNEQM